MKRLADANPDPASGQNRDISAAYYIEAAPVFQTSVDGRVVANAWLGQEKLESKVVARQ
jgi:hypothetical protein